MKVLDLFSGIGGFSLGLERAGMQTVAFCEIEPFCRAVLKKHWPSVPCYDDIRTLTAERLAQDGIAPINVICGGFPCQDISIAGKNAGIEGERSGLWREYARLISELRPQFVIMENVAALTFRGLLTVLGELSALGYDSEWHCIPASYAGSPQYRDRVWIVAYSECCRLQRGIGERFHPIEERSRRKEQLERLLSQEREMAIPTGKSGGVSDGLPNRAHCLKAIGNAVVPQIPEIIGRAIMTAHQRA